MHGRRCGVISVPKDTVVSFITMRYLPDPNTSKTVAFLRFE